MSSPLARTAIGRSFGPKIPISLKGGSGGVGVGVGVGGPSGPMTGGMVGAAVGGGGGVGVGSRRSNRSRPVSAARARKRGFRSRDVMRGISSGPGVGRRREAMPRAGRGASASFAATGAVGDSGGLSLALQRTT